MTITAEAAPSGQHFKEWTVVSGGVTLADASSASTTFQMPANAVEVAVAYENDTPPAPTPPTPTYKIIGGANGTWTANSNETLTIRGDGPVDQFKEVKVDGNVIEKSSYTVAEGSTIITLKAEYLKTLAVGKHSVELVWTEGSVTTSFTVKAATPAKPSQKKDVPETGDNAPLARLAILIILSGSGIVYFGRKKKSSL